MTAVTLADKLRTLGDHIAKHRLDNDTNTIGYNGLRWTIQAEATTGTDHLGSLLTWLASINPDNIEVHGYGALCCRITATADLDGRPIQVWARLSTQQCNQVAQQLHTAGVISDPGQSYDLPSIDASILWAAAETSEVPA